MSPARQSLLTLLCALFPVTFAVPCAADSCNKTPLTEDALSASTTQSSQSRNQHGHRQYYWAPFCAQIPEIDGIDPLSQPKASDRAPLPKTEEFPGRKSFRLRATGSSRIRLSAKPELPPGDSAEAGRIPASPLSVKPLSCPLVLPTGQTALYASPPTWIEVPANESHDNAASVLFENWQIEPLAAPAKSEE